MGCDNACAAIGIWIFFHEDEGRIFLRNVDKHLADCVLSTIHLRSSDDLTQLHSSYDQTCAIQRTVQALEGPSVQLMSAL